MFARLSIGARLITVALALAPASSQHEKVSALPAHFPPPTTTASSSDCSTTLSRAEAREFVRALTRVQTKIRIDLARMRRLAVEVTHRPHPFEFFGQSNAVLQRLVHDIDALASSAQFGAMHIADGSLTWICIQIAPSDVSGVRFWMFDCTASNLGIDQLSVDTCTNADLAIAGIDSAIAQLELRNRCLRIISALLDG